MDPIAIANQALALVKQKPIELKAGEAWLSFRPSNIEGFLVQTFWDSVRREVLSQHGWTFAMVQEPLVASDYRIPGLTWNVAYRYPEGCLRFERIVDLTANQAYGRPIYPDSRSDRTTTIEEVGPGTARPGSSALVGPTGAGVRLNEIETERYRFLRKHKVHAWRDPNDGGALKRVILTNIPYCIGEFVVDAPDPAVWPDLFMRTYTFLLASRIGNAVTGKEAEAARAYAFYRAEMRTAQAKDANESDDKPRTEAPWITARRT